jgi:ferredoxin--NADP+ reductase
MYKILKKRQLSELVYEIQILAPHVALNAKPGQFVIVVVENDGERIPLTIANINKEHESVSLIFQAVGYSTKKMSLLECGDYIPDILGPLGEEAPIEGYDKVLVIGGGVGIAPLYPQVKAMKEAGAQITGILGGRSDDLIILKDEFKDLFSSLYFATNDGSLGVKGFVTDVLTSLVEEGNDYDLVIAIGPLVMMKAVCDVTKKFHLKTNVSLNPIMIDGTGMCGGCRVKIGNEIKFACVHGPDFDGHLVDFEEAIKRQGIYTKEEHLCKLAMEV